MTSDCYHKKWKGWRFSEAQCILAQNHIIKCTRYENIHTCVFTVTSNVLLRCGGGASCRWYVLARVDCRRLWTTYDVWMTCDHRLARSRPDGPATSTSHSASWRCRRLTSPMTLAAHLTSRLRHRSRASCSRDRGTTVRRRLPTIGRHERAVWSKRQTTIDSVVTPLS